MAGAALDLTGDKKLLRQLRALGKVAQGKAIRPANRAATKIMHTDAKRRVPVDTGTLRKNIKLRAGKVRRNSGKFQHFVAWSDREKFDIKPGTKGFYPAAVEYGTEHMAAQSHIRAARIAKGKQVETRMVRSIKTIVLRAAKTT